MSSKRLRENSVWPAIRHLTVWGKACGSRHQRAGADPPDCLQGFVIWRTDVDAAPTAHFPISGAKSTRQIWDTGGRYGSESGETRMLAQFSKPLPAEKTTKFSDLARCLDPNQFIRRGGRDCTPRSLANRNLFFQMPDNHLRIKNEMVR